LFSSHYANGDFRVESEKKVIDKMSDAQSVFACNQGKSIRLIKKVCLNIRKKGLMCTFKEGLKYAIEDGLLGSRTILLIIDAFQNNNRVFCKRLEFGANKASSRGLAYIGACSNSLFEHKDRGNFIKFWEDRFPKDIRLTVEKAEEFVNHRFTVFDQTLEFDGDIDWHVDPLTKKRWPKIHYKRIDYVSGWKLSDIKYSWELNKHLHFVTLGKAYYYTKDEKYSKEFTKQICSWIKQNPYKIGINWISNIQIAQRIISWIVSYHLFQESVYFKEHCLESFLKSIYYQTEVLFNKRHTPRNNHRIGAICSIVIIGLVFPEFRKFNQWINEGFKELEKALEEQVFQDGVDKEQTISYQKAVIEFLLLTHIMAKRNNLEIPEKVKRKLHQMITHLAYLITPDQRLPIVGDNSDERAYVVSEVVDFWDPRTLISAGAIIFSDPHLRKISKSYTVDNFWLLGIEGFEKWMKIKPSKSSLRTCKSFDDGGHFVLRSDWGRDSDYFFIRCGEFGFNKTCAHSHCDLLSMILYVSGRPVLIDSGTFRYNTNKEDRDYYRKISAHNTVQVDGEEQGGMQDTFKSESRIITGRCIKFGDDCFKFKGYTESKTGIRHVREVSFIGKGHWAVSDTIDAVKNDYRMYLIRWFFQLAPTLRVRVSGCGEFVHILGHKVDIEVKRTGDDTTLEMRQEFISPSYGKKESHTRICFFLKSKLPVTHKFEFIQRLRR